MFIWKDLNKDVATDCAQLRTNAATWRRSTPSRNLDLHNYFGQLDNILWTFYFGTSNYEFLDHLHWNL